MAYEGIDFVPSVAFEPNWFDQTLGYLAERAEDGIQAQALGHGLDQLQQLAVEEEQQLDKCRLVPFYKRKTLVLEREFFSTCLKLFDFFQAQQK